jgi:hypothetical protein
MAREAGREIMEPEECQDCPCLFENERGENECCLGFAGPHDDCTRAGIAYEMEELYAHQIAELKTQIGMMSDALKFYTELMDTDMGDSQDAWVLFDDMARKAIEGTPKLLWWGRGTTCVNENGQLYAFVPTTDEWAGFVNASIKAIGADNCEQRRDAIVILLEEEKPY